MALTSAPRSITEAPNVAAGLTEAEAAQRLAERVPLRTAGTSRSYASIVRANVLTVFNLILAGFGIVTLIFGDPRDALFLGIIIANSGIGITQEVRAKRALDRLALLVAPTATVRRDGRVRPLSIEEVVVDDIVMLAAGDQVIADGTLVSATDLRVDQSILTGESEPVGLDAGDPVLSVRSLWREPACTACAPSVSTASPHGSPGRHARSGIPARLWSVRSTGCCTRWWDLWWGSERSSVTPSTTDTCHFTPRWRRRPPGWSPWFRRV